MLSLMYEKELLIITVYSLFNLVFFYLQSGYKYQKPSSISKWLGSLNYFHNSLILIQYEIFTFFVVLVDLL